MSHSLVTTPVDTRKAIAVQFGCGLSSPDNWINFDSSPTLRLQKIPLFGNLVPDGPFGRFPKTVRYGDILKGLPIAENSVDFLYCSHVLEHLTVVEAKTALQNCYQYLKPDGIFRLVLPDLEIMAREYVSSTSSDAAHKFMSLAWLGEQQQLSTIKVLRQCMSRSRHLWMWDFKSLSEILEQVGFQSIKRARLGDSQLEVFDAVEDPERWTYELGIQCQKLQA